MGAPFHTSSDGIFLYHQRLSTYKWLRHGFSLRKNQHRAGDELWPERISTPRDYSGKSARLVRSVAGRDWALATLRQVHSDRVFKASRLCCPIHLKAMAG
jgi:copper oxidase (laccase) domain-containing protein